MKEQDSFKDPVSMTVRATPVPIPNTMVKPYSADDTAWEAVWESRLMPVLIFRDSSMVEHSAVNR